ncbi:MAG: hypothetical protein IT373_19345 [Polyangiaceae bacterium]|nr:hypothetical protein [Polyangiaceae bacterium]
MTARWLSGRILVPLTGSLVAAALGACGKGFTPPEGTGGSTSSTTTTTTTTTTSGGAGGTTTSTTTTVSGGGGAGGVVECVSPAECPGVDGQCQHRSCEAGACGIVLEAVHEPCDEGGGEECDGQGACLKLDGTACAAGEECSSGSCADSVCCDTACSAACEACDTGGSVGTCTPFAVLTDPEGECGPGATCDGASQCRKTDGSACGAAAECLSGSCADGVCCATDCSGTCSSCALPGKEGTCTLHAAGTDPEGECAPGSCDVGGACATGATDWVKTLGSTGSDILYGLAADAAGNVYATGDFTGSVDFGCGALVSAGADDVFVVKYDAAGTCLWQRAYGGTGTDVGRGLALDPAGNVLVTGTFAGTASIAGASLVAQGASDVFLAKLAANGTPLWGRAYGGNQASGQELGVGVVTDANNNVYLTGILRSSATIGTLLTNQGLADAFLAKVSSAGSVLWSRSIGSSGDDAVVAPTLDASGAVVVAGAHGGVLNLGGSPLDPGSGDNLYVAKYDAAGVHQWSRTVGNGSPVSVTGLAVSSAGRIAVAGLYRDTITFVTQPFAQPLASAGGADAFVASFDAAGTAVAGARYGDAADQGRTVVAYNSANELVLAGDLLGTVNFGNGVTLTSAGLADAYAVRNPSNSATLWGHRWGDGAGQSVLAVALDGADNAIIGGYFAGTVDFGNGFVNSTGVNDVFMLKLAP